MRHVTVKQDDVAGLGMQVDVFLVVTPSLKGIAAIVGVAHVLDHAVGDRLFKVVFEKGQTAALGRIIRQVETSCSYTNRLTAGGLPPSLADSGSRKSPCAIPAYRRAD